MADIGLRATEDSLADLLVTDLAGGSSELRKRIPGLLDELHNKDGLVVPRWLGQLRGRGERRCPQRRPD